MVILGINSAYHESAACVIRDGQLIAFAEEERFNRVKHGKPALIDNPHVLPVAAITYCLKEAGLSPADIQQVGYSFKPGLRLQNIGMDSGVDDRSWGGATGERTFEEKLHLVPQLLKELGVPSTAAFHWIEHHQCHAASAYLVSPFDDAAILTVDGIGEFGSTALAWGHAHGIRPLQVINYPNSLGLLWEKFSSFLGFDVYDACKVMGLSAYGDPQRFAEPFARIVRLTDTGFTIDGGIMAFRSPNDFSRITQLLGMPPGDQELNCAHQDVAAALQQATERVLLHLAGRARQLTQSAHLCLAGGVALNCCATRRLEEQGLFGQIFIQPAAHDAGTALGAAYWIWNTLMGQPRSQRMHHAYWGPSFSEAETLSALQHAELSFRHSADPASETAELLAADNIVGWFQGRMEAGPRALGNRSLLTDPRPADVRSRLNRKVKHREDFRPFAPSILAEEAANWFELPHSPGLGGPADFMLSTYKVRPEKQAQIPAVLHCDHTSRIQIVRSEINPRYHQLLSAFFKLAGVPLLLNTSFNDGEPIVCSPQDAIDTFKRTKIDHLVIGNHIIDRKDNE
jgi:carbamoyltransferase